MIDKEYILCAAIKRVEPRKCPLGGYPYYEGTNDILNVELGYRHHDIYQRFYKEVSHKPSDQGFYTSTGRFVGRQEAMQIAYNARQLKKDVKPFKNPCDLNNMYNELYSEDLY